jgi:hypothetical protein
MSAKPSTSDPQVGLHQLYADNPERADELVWGRRANPFSRRGFLERLGLVSMSAAVGAEIVFSDKMPAGLIPAALAQATCGFGHSRGLSGGCQSA